MARRLSKGGDIDRSAPVSFTFDGRIYGGFKGDTLASALLAEGVGIVGRSFKYHRPRGVFAAGAEECNALMQVGDGARSTPNMRATEVLLHDGLTSRAVNCWPNARYDLGGLNALMSRFLPAGFYYKTFMWPDWHIYEGFIRRAAGLGRVPKQADPDRYETVHAHCDVLVVGGGAAGLSAARAAAAGGARVILTEQDRLLGGQLRWDGGEIDGLPAKTWIDHAEAGLRKQPETRILTCTTATGYFDHNGLSLLESVSHDDPGAPAHLPRYRQWQVRADHVILATGSIERPLVFPGNDRSGVMLARAVRQYIAGFAVRPGEVLTVFTNNDEAYRTLAPFRAAGGVLRAVVDTRPRPAPSALALAEAQGVEVITGASIVATRGALGLRSVMVRTSSGAIRRLTCNLLASSGGSNPTVHLFGQSGGKTRFDDDRLMFRPSLSVQNQSSVGACDGELTLSKAVEDGYRAGVQAAADAGYPSALEPSKVGREHPPAGVAPYWMSEGKRGKAFIDLQNDVTTSDVDLAVRENFASVEHLKRYTTLGMASDQGKTANVNGLAILASVKGASIADTGTTRARFPYTPTPLAAFAGRSRGELFRPLRRLQLHDAHLALNPLMEDFGGWLRPAVYLRGGETREQAEQREAAGVRTGVGLFDGSPLGKIEVRGPDAARFLDFVYANTMSTLKPGKIRYGLFLNERGVILDDGVCARLGFDHFLVGASSAGAERIASWLDEWLQCEFPDYEVLIAPVSTSWAVVTLAGPAARQVLLDAGVDFDISAGAFPHMSLRRGSVAGVDVRILRVSFTGEVSYEINVPSDRADDVWRALRRSGERHSLQPFGIDALNLLRLEKGYLHIGSDTDGTSTPLNIGWDHVLKRKSDFIGKRSLFLPVNQAQGALNLVGLATSSGRRLPVGAHAVKSDGRARLSDGFVTSSGFSPTLKRGVALAMIHDGRARMGETVELAIEEAVDQATIVNVVAFDQDGARLHA